MVMRHKVREPTPGRGTASARGPVAIPDVGPLPTQAAVNELWNAMGGSCELVWLSSLRSFSAGVFLYCTTSCVAGKVTGENISGQG